MRRLVLSVSVFVMAACTQAKTEVSQEANAAVKGAINGASGGSVSVVQDPSLSGISNVTYDIRSGVYLSLIHI